MLQQSRRRVTRHPIHPKQKPESSLRKFVSHTYISSDAELMTAVLLPIEKDGERPAQYFVDLLVKLGRADTYLTEKHIQEHIDVGHDFIRIDVRIPTTIYQAIEKLSLTKFKQHAVSDIYATEGKTTVLLLNEKQVACLLDIMYPMEDGLSLYEELYNWIHDNDDEYTKVLIPNDLLDKIEEAAQCL